MPTFQIQHEGQTFEIQSDAELKPADIDAVIAATPEGQRQQKAKERTAEAEQALERFRPAESIYDDPMAVLGGRAGHEMTKAALLKGGKVGDVAIGVLGPLAGALAGGLTPVPGGAAAGGASASMTADALVQGREYLRGERDDFSKGRLLMSGATGAFVPGGVKAAATPLLTAGKTLAVRAGQGAGLGAVHEAGSQAIDAATEGKKFSGGDILSATLLGTLFGGGFGVLEGAAPHVLNALRGKTVAEAKKVIAEELPKLDNDAAMDAATKAEVRGVLEGAQARIDDVLGVKATPAAPTSAAESTIGRVADAEKTFGGEGPLTRTEKAPERAAGLAQGRAEDLRGALLARQLGGAESTVLTGDEVQNQLTKLETRPGESRRERARLLAKRQAATPSAEGEVAPTVALPTQAERLLSAEGHDAGPRTERPLAPRTPATAESPLPQSSQQAGEITPKVDPMEAETAAPPRSKTRKDYITEAINADGANYKYTVMRMGGDYPDAIQVDVFDRQGHNLASSSPEELRVLGVDIPDVPAQVPQGQYSLDEVRAAIAKNNASPAATREATGPTSEAKPAPKTKRIGLRADGEMDILSQVQDLGGIKHPDNARSRGGEYDGWDEDAMKDGLTKLLIRKDGGGSTPDQLVQDLQANGVNVRDADQLFEMMQAAKAKRKGVRADTLAANRARRFEDAFLGDAEKIAQMEREGKMITVDDLRVGDTFTVNREKFTVKDIDENGFVTVQDGLTRTLDPNTPIFPDKGTVKRAGKKVPDFVTPADETAAAAPLRVFHGGKEQISSFDKSRIGSDRGEGWLGTGFYFSPDESAARAYGEAVTSADVSLSKPFRFPEGVNPIKFVEEHGGPKAFTEWVKKQGYDGIISDRILHQVVAFEPTQIKVVKPTAEPKPSEPFSLASATNEQQAAEAATARERLLAQERKDQIGALAEKPLTGDSSDVGQGTLLASDEDLLSGPSAETLGKKGQRGSISSRLLASTPVHSALGGVAGAAYGSTQGDTKEERAQNMILGGLAGAGAAGLLSKGGKVLARLAFPENGTLEIDRHLAPPPGKSVAEKIEAAPSNLRAATMTIFAPLDKLDADVRKGASWLFTLPKRELPLSREFEQVAGASGKAGQDVRDFVNGVREAVGNEADLQNLNRLIALRRIGNYLDHDIPIGGWDRAKVTNDIAELGKTIGAQRLGELDSIASGLIQREADDALRLQVESGRISEEAYKLIKDKNDFYARFNVLDHAGEGNYAGGRAVDIREQLAKPREGISNPDFHLENPLAALSQHIFNARILAEKNLKMLKLAEVAPNDMTGQFIRKLDAGDTPRRGMETVNYYDNGKPLRLEVSPEVARAVKGLDATETGWVVNALRKASAPFRFGTTTANLAFQPINFGVADQPNLWLVSKYGVQGAEDVWRAPIDFAHGIYSSIFENILGGEGGKFAKATARVPLLKDANAAAAKLAREFYESGASGSNWQAFLDRAGGSVKEKQLLAGLKIGEHSVLDGIGAINKAIEESTKMMGFKRGLRIEGIEQMTPAQAEEAIKKVVTEVRNFAGSPDFFRSGWAVRDLNNLAQMFLNARVQGLTNLGARLGGDVLADAYGAVRSGRGIKGAISESKESAQNAAAAWLRIASTIGVGAAYLWFRNHQPENVEDFAKRSEVERKNYFLIPRYGEDGKPLYSANEFGQNVREYWRIPKREVLQYFGNTVETALDFAREKDPEALKKYAEEMAENISPINISGRTGQERFESAIGGAHPLLKTAYEQASGRDTFRHRDIVPQPDLKAIAHTAPEKQYTETTPKAFIDLAAAMPKGAPDNLRSPMMLQNLTEGLSGRMLTQFLPKKQAEGRDPKAALLANNPITSRFVGPLYVDRAKEQEEIDTLKSAEAETRVDRMHAATDLLKRLRTATPEEGSQQLTALQTSDPELLDEVLKRAGRADMDVIDRQLRTLGVKTGARATFIANQVKRLSSPEAVRDYLLRLTQGENAPLTPDVLKQVAALLANEVNP